MATFKIFFSLLSSKEKSSFFLLFLLMTLSGVADMFGVGSILPFLTLATDPNGDELNLVYGLINDLVAAQSRQELTICRWLTFTTLYSRWW